MVRLGKARLGRRGWIAAGVLTLAGLAGAGGLGVAHSFTVPDWCGGVRPCPPPCLGAPEVARDPEDFIKLARYELGPARRWRAPARPARVAQAAPPRWRPWAPRRIYQPRVALETPSAVDLPPA